MRLVWDEAKNNANRKKHRVSFEEAGELFTSGTDFLEIFDEAHSDTEDRFLSLGPISGGLILVVSTETEEDVVRIISARWAAKTERLLYQKFIEGCP